MNEDEERPVPGRMRFQDGSTTPREPTLAERRAREQALRRDQEAAQAAQARSKRRRKRILIGAGATVGIVAVIAVGYAIAAPDDEVQARCVDDNDVVVDDSNCVTPASSTTYHSHAGAYPIFIGGAGRQYHYNYGGAGTVGQRVAGGTAVTPSGTTKVITSTGKTISRGGLGVSSGGSSGGSSSGGSKSSGS